MKNLFLSALMLVALSICTMSVKAETLTVTSNSSSGISQANCIGTLSDGTILGFYVDYYQWGSQIEIYHNYAYFCGANGNSESIEVPDKISFANKELNIVQCGYSSSYNLDFDEATSVSSLTLPSTITYIYSVPSNVHDLHLKSTTPPSLYDSSSIPNSTTVWVPQSAFTSYQNYSVNSNSYWFGKDVHYEGWVPNSVTVTINSPGTFAQVLLGQVEQWSDVDELTVIGKFNETDLGYLSRLKNVTKIDLSQTDIKSIKGCAGLTLLKNILLPSTVVEVKDEAFKGCSSLKDISIPNAKEIGSSAFYYCRSLTTVSLPSATSIGSSAFYYCRSLTTISLPVAASIGSSAFEDCSSLTTISLPYAASIGSGAFGYCSSLTTISLPSATSIGSSAFYYCRNLTTVSLPSATSIGSSALNSCSSLKSITLPTTLQSLGSDAFEYCSKLEDVYCHVVSPLNTTAFSYTGASSITLHVPAFSVSAYILHDNWYTFNKIVALDGNVDKVNIISDFTITELKGLAEKVDLDVLSNYDGSSSSSNNYEGHLTVSANGKWNLGEYLQTQSNRYYSSWNSSNSTYDYKYYNSTIIPYNEMAADNVTVRYSAQTNRWNFISFPFDVNVSDIEYPEGTLWVIRKYSGEDRASMTGNTWQNMTDGMTLKAGEGYILHCSDGNTDSWNTSYVEFTFKAVNNSNKNNIFAYQNVEKPLTKYASDLAHNRNWNLVGNPYPCFYDTRNIEHNGVITVWNGNGYTAYSLLDDNYVLRPNESFFVQCPADATSMTFKAEGRQHTYEANDNVSYSKARVACANNRQVLNFTLSGAEYTDKARVVINESAKLDYEISCDASKFMSSNTAVPQIYVIENGQKMAIDERPLSEGTIALGMYIGEAGDYTIGISSAATESITLTDHVTGKAANLNSETYTFYASKGTSDSRFTIQIGDATGVKNISTGKQAKKSAIYSVSGHKLSAPQKGINIINGNKTLVK